MRKPSIPLLPVDLLNSNGPNVGCTLVDEILNANFKCSEGNGSSCGPCENNVQTSVPSPAKTFGDVNLLGNHEDGVRKSWLTFLYGTVPPDGWTRTNVILQRSGKSFMFQENGFRSLPEVELSCEENRWCCCKLECAKTHLGMFEGLGSSMEFVEWLF